MQSRSTLAENQTADVESLTRKKSLLQHNHYNHKGTFGSGGLQLLQNFIFFSCSDDQSGPSDNFSAEEPRQNLDMDHVPSCQFGLRLGLR